MWRGLTVLVEGPEQARSAHKEEPALAIDKQGICP
jgi:hypothetical protein